MNTKENTKTVSTKFDSAFIEAGKDSLSAREAMSKLLPGIAKELTVKATDRGVDLRPLRSHVAYLLGKAGYNEASAAQLASGLTNEFAGVEKKSRKVKTAKGAKAIVSPLVEFLREKFPDADIRVLRSAFRLAMRELGKVDAE